MCNNFATSSSYYGKNAKSFCDDTLHVDLSSIYRRFCPYLEKGCRVLDAGCGSGRDIIAFKKMGYEVEAFDASLEIAQIAQKNSGIKVTVDNFRTYSINKLFDAIWCCSSLLHTPFNELVDDMRNMSNALKEGGIWYVSFKHGEYERTKEGRFFTDINESRLNTIVNEVGNLKIIDIWLTDDLRPGRNDKWLNAFLRKE